MRLAAGDINQHLERGLRPLYVISGDEPLTVVETVDAIRQAARQQGYTEREIFNVERGFNWQQLVQNSKSLSLFASRRLIEINIPSGKPGIDGSKILQAYVADLPPDTLTLITLPRIDKRDQGAWFKALDSVGVLLMAYPVDTAKLAAWIGKRLAAQGQQGDTETLDFIANQVEGNLLAAHQEIQKLGLLYPAGRLASEHVRDAVLNVSRFDAFQLGDALLAGDAIRTLKILDNLKSEGVEPIALTGMLIWLLRAALKVKLAQARGMDLMSAFGQAKIWGAKQNLMRQALSRLSLKKLQSALLKMAEIDKVNKGLVQGEPWLELSRLCMGLAKTTPARNR